MKKIVKILSIPVFCLSVIVIVHNTMGNRQQNASIVGTWISESDPKAKYIFNSNLKCHEYYEGELIASYTYEESNFTPQCGEAVPVDQYTQYLKLTDISDPDFQVCYEINGITSTRLSIRFLDRGGAKVYLRQ